MISRLQLLARANTRLASPEDTCIHMAFLALLPVWKMIKALIDDLDVDDLMQIQCYYRTLVSSLVA